MHIQTVYGCDGNQVTVHLYIMFCCICNTYWLFKWRQVYSCLRLPYLCIENIFMFVRIFKTIFQLHIFSYRSEDLSELPSAMCGGSYQMIASLWLGAFSLMIVAVIARLA